MFVGHYAAALAARTAEPRAPLWTYVGACQLMDIGWSVLIMAGVEKMRIDPHVAGGLDLYFMPFTHSLPGSLAWSLAAAVLARWLLKLPWAAAAMVGAAVFSHWLLDLLVHHPDLVLWPGGPRAGFAFWDFPVPEMALEMGLVAMAATAWMGRRRDEGRRIWPAVLFVALLTAVQVTASLSPLSGAAVASGGMALGVYLAITAAAWLLDRRPAARTS